MPIHDWTRVVSGIFHDFHHCWISEIRNALNAGLLPPGYYALAEQYAGGPHPDVLALERFDDGNREGGHRTPTPLEPMAGTVAVAERPPHVKLKIRAEETIYAQKANRVAIRHITGDRVIAYVELVSPGNKQTESKLKTFFEKMLEAIEQGRHLLIVDLFPPRNHDPHGIHAAFWEYAYGDSEGVTTDKPLTLAAYEAVDVGDEETAWFPTGYFEPVAVGQILPDMPLFVQPGVYVNVPLEQTYMKAWSGVPQRWKEVIEASRSSGPNGTSH